MQCCKITYFVGKFSHGVSIFAELFNTCCKARYTAIITPPPPSQATILTAASAVVQVQLPDCGGDGIGVGLQEQSVLFA